MTDAQELAVCFVLGYLRPLDGKRGLNGSVRNIENAVSAASDTLKLNDIDKEYLRKNFNVRKAGDK